MASMVTLAHHVLEPAVGLAPADAPAELLRERVAVQRRRTGDQRAQERHLFGGEVASVIAALDHDVIPAAMRARLRSALIDQGSHGERSSGARPPLSAHAASHAASHASSQRRGSMPPGARIPRTKYITAVNRAPVSLSEPNESRLPITGPLTRALGRVVVHRRLRAVDEDAQALAMVQQRAQRLALARVLRQGGQLPPGFREQAVERFLQRGLRRVERRALPGRGRGRNGPGEPRSGDRSVRSARSISGTTALAAPRRPRSG